MRHGQSWLWHVRLSSTAKAGCCFFLYYEMKQEELGEKRQTHLQLTIGAFCSDWFLWIDSVCCFFRTGLMISLWRLLCVWHPNWIQELQISGPKKDFKKYLEEIDFHGDKSALWAALDVKQDGYITVACQVQAYPTLVMLRIWPDVTRWREILHPSDLIRVLGCELSIRAQQLFVWLSADPVLDTLLCLFNFRSRKWNSLFVGTPSFCWRNFYHN